jgi:hypothetical protein
MKKLLLCCLVAMLAGCTKTATDSAASTPPAGGKMGDARAAGEAKEKKYSRPGGLLGVGGRTKNYGILYDIGLSCKVEDISRLPKTLEELKRIVKENGNAVRAIDNGEFVLVANARVAGDSIFLYESKADSNGVRLVLMGDGSIHKKSAQEFKMLKPDLEDGK